MLDFIKNVFESPGAKRILWAILGATVIQVVVYMIRRALRSRISDLDTRYRLQKAVQYVGFVIMLFQLALVYRAQLGGFTVAFGVAGAGIAFALQEVIASVAGWAAVSLGGFYDVGDRVQLGGIKGDVIDIGILRTTIMEIGEWVKGDLYNGRVVRVANSFVFKEPVFNYSGDFPFLWDEIRVPIKYGSDYRLAKEVLTRIANEEVAHYGADATHAWREMVKKFRLEDASTAPMVTLVANDNWMEFTIRYLVACKARRMTQDKLFFKILDAVEASEGKLAMASMTVQLVEMPQVRVKMEEGDMSALQGSMAVPSVAELKNILLGTLPVGRVLLLGLCLVLLIVIAGAVKRWLLDISVRKRGLDLGKSQAVLTISYYLVLVLGTLAVLRLGGVDLGSLAVLAGAFSLGVGFGLQTIIHNFVSGLIILLERPLKVGDRIEIEGVTGTVVPHLLPGHGDRHQRQHRRHRPQLPAHLFHRHQLDPDGPLGALPGAHRRVLPGRSQGRHPGPPQPCESPSRRPR